MARYRKKPVVIEAVQWDGGSPLPKGCFYGHGEAFDPFMRCFIETLEGTMCVSVGDWIITGVKGERYPCKPDIFEATYDRLFDDDELAPEVPCHQVRE